MATGIIVRSCGTRVQSRFFGRRLIFSNLVSTDMTRKSGPYLEYNPEMDVEYFGNRATLDEQSEILHFSKYCQLPARVIPDVFPFVVKSDGTRLATAHSISSELPHWTDATVSKCVLELMDNDGSIPMPYELCPKSIEDFLKVVEQVLQCECLVAIHVMQCILDTNEVIMDMGNFNHVKYLMLLLMKLALSPYWPKSVQDYRVFYSTSQEDRQVLAIKTKLNVVEQRKQVSPKTILKGVTDAAMYNVKGFQLVIGEGQSMRDESNNLGGAGQLVTAMLAQFTNSDVTIPVWGFILGPSEYKIFSLRPVEGTALLQEYPSVQHRLKMHDFLPLLGVAESFTVILFPIGIIPLADVPTFMKGVWTHGNLAMNKFLLILGIDEFELPQQDISMQQANFN